VERGLDVAVTLIFSLEKKCRLNNDFKNLKEICLHAVRICKDKKDWDKLNSVLAIINKRNAASKITISAVVTESITYVEETPSLHVKIELIKALKDVCEGKIYVEGESAKLHLMLSKIYEERGEIDAACDIVQDVHVETYGSLSKKEKAEYIVEQIRLTLLKKDYVRTLIHSRKMNVKFLDEIGFEEIKIKFFTMMVEYHTAVDANTWEISQAYYKVREYFLLI
jgi:26S proteasome regulatory subunit N5